MDALDDENDARSTERVEEGRTVAQIDDDGHGDNGGSFNYDNAQVVRGLDQEPRSLAELEEHFLYLIHEEDRSIAGSMITETPVGTHSRLENHYIERERFTFSYNNVLV